MIAICEFCNKEYKTYKNWYNRPGHHTCSRKCAGELKIKLSEKKCNQCGKTFSGKSHQGERLYCSRKCRQDYQNTHPKIHKKICRFCKKEYFVHHEQINKSYCSIECRNLSRFKNNNGKYCLECGKSFINCKAEKFCSYSCFRIFSDRNSTKHEMTCKLCGNKFLRNPGEIKKAKNHFCSSECRFEFNRGANHYEWKNVYDKTEKLALRQWSIKIKSRDNFKCCYCGESNIKLLQAHHIKTRKNFSELQFDINNGITLCITCHAKEHRNNNVVNNLILSKLKKHESKEKELDTRCCQR